MDDIFEPVARSKKGKVRCKVCGTIGYPVSGGWTTSHRRGHKPCHKCGRQMAVLMDGRARVHARCPRTVPSP